MMKASVALITLCLFCSSALMLLGQESYRKSIHQMEAEAHRDLVVREIISPMRPAPLAPAAPSRISRTVFGFYPYWAPGFAQVRFQDLTHLAVFSVEADGSGQIANNRGWPNMPLIQAAHQANVRVVLVCTLFDSAQIRNLLSSAAARQTLIGNLRNLVILGGADGVNIDFEGIPADQNANLITFMKELAIALRETMPGAHISIDTPAVDWSNAFDYAALADICDALMIMAYDYHWSGSANPGPVSPLSGSTVWGKYGITWTIADYLSKVGSGKSNKLVLGIPYYGYDWPSKDDSLNTSALGSATSRTYTALAAAEQIYGKRWDAFSSTPWYFYNSITPHQTWYDDAASLSLKYDQIYLNQMQGIGIWALTYDQNRVELWQLIEDRFGLSIVPEPPEITTPSVFFDTAGLPVALRERGSVPAAAFEVAVGTTPGGKEVTDFKSVGLQHQVLIQGLALTSGRTYYITARSISQQGNAGPAGAVAAVMIDTSGSVTRKYLPHWISNSEFYTGLAVVNASLTTRAVLLRGHVIGRAETLVNSWVLKPGQQLAQVVSQQDLLGTSIVGKEGWLEVLYQGDGFQGMYLVGDTEVSRSLAGSPLVDAGQNQVVPLLNAERSVIYIVNSGTSTARLQLGDSGSSGATISKSVDLEAGGMLASDLQSLLPGFRGQLLFLDSDKPVVCTVMLGGGRDSAALPALNAAQPLRAGAFPYFAAGSGYSSRIEIINPSNEIQTVKCRLVGPQGLDLVRETVISLVPLSASILDWDAPQVREAVTGAIEVTVTAGSGVIGGELISADGGNTLAALPLDSSASTLFVFPQLAQAQGYWTGMSIANAGPSAAEVTVEAMDADGDSLGIYAFQLPSGGVRVGLIYEWIKSTLGIASGRVNVRSTAPVLATEIFGSDSLSFMVSVPGR